MTILRMLLIAIVMVATAVGSIGNERNQDYAVASSAFIIIWSVWAMFLIP